MSLLITSGGWPAATPDTVSPPCTVDIRIEQHDGTKVYTSGSVISGNATIRVTRDVWLATLHITFSGVTTTALYSYTGRKTSRHQFLLLKMPIPDGISSGANVLEAGRSYTVPFNFTVPHRLTVGTCCHKCSRSDVWDKHMRLPPSVGNKGVTSSSSSKQIGVFYFIKATVTQSSPPSRGTVVIAEARRITELLPELIEDPPLELSPQEGEHRMRNVINTRSSLLRSINGKLIASVRQPHAVILTPDGRGASSSWAHVDFHFVSFKSGARPPKIRLDSVKILSTTVFTTKPFSSVPRFASSTHHNAVSTFQRSTHAIRLRPPDDIVWVNRCSGRAEGSVISCFPFGSLKKPSMGQRNETHTDQFIGADTSTEFTTSLDLQFTLRSRDYLLLPTFYSCFAARTCDLRIKFSVGETRASVLLIAPVQITVRAATDSIGDELPTFDSATGYGSQNDEAGSRLTAQTAILCNVASNISLPKYEPAGS